MTKRNIKYVVPQQLEVIKNIEMFEGFVILRMFLISLQKELVELTHFMNSKVYDI